jgi:hypothetical protein
MHLLTVVADDRFETVDEAGRRLAELTRVKLEVFAPRAGAVRRVHLHVRVGDPGEQLVEMVHEIEAELLVIGASAAGTSRPPLVDVPRYAADHAPCVVMLVRVPDYGQHPLRDKQCPACVEVRGETDGEVWFCAAHSGRKTMTSSLLMPNSVPSLRGGPML